MKGPTPLSWNVSHLSRLGLSTVDRQGVRRQLRFEDEAPGAMACWNMLLRNFDAASRRSQRAVSDFLRDFERRIRDHLARDIAAIPVNRWPTATRTNPILCLRKSRLAIANGDAGAYAYTAAAINQRGGPFRS